MLSELQQVVDLLNASTYTVALTGAGISTASGIPDFRSEQSGLWTHADPFQVASIWAFHDHPEQFYRWIRPLIARAETSRPNGAHTVLAEMERAGRLHALITQNIDSLHQRAGSQRVLELHGHARTASCLLCRACTPAEAFWASLAQGAAPPLCPKCGGPVKPDVVLFGEPLPYEAVSAAQQEALAADLFLVVGTSLEVMPAADLPLLAKRRGARLVLINLSPTPFDDRMDVVVRMDVVKALQQIWKALSR